ncbi:MAG: flagellar biosynthesis protein FlhF [Treponema sp.]|nr:flagellar biosynthesis protein FlhF [Treponema sp.]MCL2233062.1 flagellar biosynthesis protein FlhF [Treponema sp.]
MSKYFIEQAPTYDEAELKARAKYGEQITILMREATRIPGGPFNLFPKAREGVKITGIIPRHPQPRTGTPSGEYMPRPPLQKDAVKETAVKDQSAAALAAEKERFLAMAKAGKEEASIKEILVEMKSIKERLEHQGLTASREEHPTLNRIDDLLIINEFPPSYRKTLMERARNEIPPVALDNYDAVQDRFLEWIGESIKISANDTFNVRPRIMVLIGPTGIGKTTTIAKLAASFGIDDKARQKRSIALITIDAYRIGAREQLEKYGKWMEFPCYSAVDYDEMKKIIAMNTARTDLFLVDTIGRNHLDMVQLGEMKQILDACGALAEYHLAVAATTKPSDLKEILQQFEAFHYRSVLVTKMDETKHVGNVIGSLAEKGKSVSYMTDGQTVPTDIRKASVIQFLMKLEGFRVNRIKLEEKFPDKGHDQMQKWR